MAKPPIRTRPDGTRYPITSKKGGAAAVAATVLASGMIAVGGGFGGSGAAGSAADSAIARALQARTTNAKGEARKGRGKAAWKRFGMRQLKRRIEPAADCVLNSYGDVRQFFLRTPCRWLRRTLVTIGDGDGNTVVVAISLVRMSTARQARQLKELTDTDGTGNVAAIGAVGPRLGDIEFTGEHYDSHRRGRMTVIAEAEPVRGQPGGATMDAATEVAVVLPPP